MARSKVIKPGYLFTPRYTNYAFSLLFLLYMFDYIDRMVVSSLTPFIQEDWGIFDTQVGALSSIVDWSIVAPTLPISVLSCRAGPGLLAGGQQGLPTKGLLFPSPNQNCR